MGNTATVGIIERDVRDFDPYALFIRTTPDPGDVHIYTDQDPTWYGHRYKEVPYISETGIYNMPEAGELFAGDRRQRVEGLVWGFVCKDYVATHPEIIHHMLEFGGGEPRTLAGRATQVDDMTKVDLPRFSAATRWRRRSLRRFTRI